jgi:hypothetical protein
MSRVSMSIEAIYSDPHINWRHIDGPLMTWAGQMHWLTWKERFLLWLGRITIHDIARSRFTGYRR